MADQHRHHEVNTAFTKTLRGSGLFKGARDWPETRISRSLINQYPDVYWRLIFTFFEAAINEQFPQAYVANVAAFLDCHGFVPAEYHHQEDRQGRHQYRTQERPRLAQLLEQFIAPNYYAANGSAERRPVFVPPPSRIWLLLENRCIWTDELASRCCATTPTGRNLFVVNFDLLHHLLVQDITDFANGTRNGDNMVVFQQRRVIRTQNAFYLTLFGMFRNEVKLLRTLVTPLELVPSPIVTAIQAHMQPTMQRLTNDIDLRTRVYRAFIPLLVSCPKFVRANEDPDTNDALWEYLQIIGAYPREWAYWALGGDYDYDHWNTGYHECAVLPTELANN